MCSALLTIATFSLVPAQSVAHADSAQLASRFTMGVFPDTQYASAGSIPASHHFMNRYGSEPYKVQTQWLADNKKAFDLKFVVHLGDVVNNSVNEGQWKAADAAMSILEKGGVPYSVLPGNHDMGPIPVVGGSVNKLAEEVGRYADYGASKVNYPGTIGVETKPSVFSGSKATKELPFYSKWFSAERAQKNPTFRERFNELNNESEYHIFSAEGHSFLVLALAYQASDRVLRWAQKVLDAHPTLPAILTTHEILVKGGDKRDIQFTKGYGEHLWNDFIKENDQIFLTLCGHNAGSGTLVTKNNKGHSVVNVLQDYQESYEGGNGLLGLLQFDFTHNTMEMLAASPYAAKKPAKTLVNEDVLYSQNERDSFIEHMDFAQRFAGFTRFVVNHKDENDPDYLDIARRNLRCRQPLLKPVTTPSKLPAYLEMPKSFVPTGRTGKQ